MVYCRRVVAYLGQSAEMCSMNKILNSNKIGGAVQKLKRRVLHPHGSIKEETKNICDLLHSCKQIHKYIKVTA